MDIIKVTNVPFLVANLTNRCNLHCDHCCYNSGEAGAELNAIHWRNAFKTFKRIGCTTLSFTGGEPLLFKDIKEIASYAHDLGYAIKINTNGTLIDEKTVAWLQEFQVFEVRVGLDGPNAQIHDAVRGAGSFDRAIRGCNLLADAGLTVSINSTIGLHNLHTVEEMIATAADVRARHVHFYSWEKIGRGETSSREALVGKDIQCLRDAVEQTRQKYTTVQLPHRTDVPCGEAWFHLMLWPDGSVVPHLGITSFSHKDTVLTNITNMQLEQIMRLFLAKTAQSYYSCAECIWQRSSRCVLTNSCCAADIIFE